MRAPAAVFIKRIKNSHAIPFFITFEDSNVLLLSVLQLYMRCRILWTFEKKDPSAVPRALGMPRSRSHEELDIWIRI